VNSTTSTLGQSSLQSSGLSAELRLNPARVRSNLSTSPQCLDSLTERPTQRKSIADKTPPNSHPVCTHGDSQQEVLFTPEESLAFYKKFFSETTADINTQDEYGRTNIMHAIDNDDEVLFSIFIGIDGVNPNIQDVDGTTALMMAASKGKLSFLEPLLAMPKIDLYKTNIKGGTAAFNAAFHGNCEALKAILEKSGYSFMKKTQESKSNTNRTKDKDGKTPLMKAAAQGDLNKVKTLLSNPKVTPNALDNNLMSAAMIAAAFGHRTSAYAILKKSGCKSQECLVNKLLKINSEK